MFAKKLPKRGSVTAVKTSEARKLRKQLHVQYPLLSEDQLSQIWEPNSGIQVQKLDGHVCYYISDGVPVVVASHEKERSEPMLLPTLYLLHIAPQIMKQIVIHDGVARKVLGGADLFLPGVVVDLNLSGRENWVKHNFSTFNKGDRIAVREVSQWAPFAIAHWTIDHRDLELRGLSGTAFEMLHLVDDCLWLEGHGKVPSRPILDVEEVMADMRERQAALEAEQQAKQDAARAEQKRIDRIKARVVRSKEAKAFVDDYPKMIKRKQKALRNVEALCDAVARGEVTPNADQKEKMSRLSLLQQEIEDVHAKQASLQAKLQLHDQGQESVWDTDDEVQPTHSASAGDGEHVQHEEPVDEWESRASDAASGTPADAVDAAAERDAVVPQDDEGEQEQELEHGQVDDATDEQGQDEAGEEQLPAVSPSELLDRAVVAAVMLDLKSSDLPILLNMFYSKFVLPRMRTLCGFSDPFNIKATQWKKFGTYIQEQTSAGWLSVSEVKKGVVQLERFDRTHSHCLEFDDGWLREEQVEDPNAVQTKVTAGKAATESKFKVPRTKPQIIQLLTKKIANKNVTIVKNLALFNIKLDDKLRSDLAKAFSASVTYTPSKENRGHEIHVQGKYVVQVAEFLAARFDIPQKYLQVESKGLSKKVKSYNAKV